MNSFDETLEQKLDRYEAQFLKLRVALGLDLHSTDDLIEVAKRLSGKKSAPLSIEGECNPTLTECSKCRNNIGACDLAYITNPMIRKGDWSGLARWLHENMTTPLPQLDMSKNDREVLTQRLKDHQLMVLTSVLTRMGNRLQELSENQQYTCPNHANKVKEGGGCVWCRLTLAEAQQTPRV